MSKRPRRDSSSSSNHHPHDPESLPDQEEDSSQLIAPAYTHTAKYTRSSTSPPPPASTRPQSEFISAMTLSSPSSSSGRTITCTLPSCPSREHPNPEAYETHYQKYHINRCHECSKNFPTGRILECHIRENHDMFAVVKKERGEKIYACFVEDCDKVCISPGKRRAHLIDKHYYHRNFNFFIVNDGIDKATSLLCASPQRKSRTRVRRVSESSATNIATLNGSSNHVGDQERKMFNGVKEEEAGTGMEIDNDVEMDNGESTPSTRSQNKPAVTASHAEGRKKHARSLSEPGQILPPVKEARIDHKLPIKENATAAKKTANEDTDMADLTSRMSAVRFIPTSVKFGRKAAGFCKK